jgi:hypothetical protein
MEFWDVAIGSLIVTTRRFGMEPDGPARDRVVKAVS